jgi:hypothetical protein
LPRTKANEDLELRLRFSRGPVALEHLKLRGAAALIPAQDEQHSQQASINTTQYANSFADAGSAQFTLSLTVAVGLNIVDAVSGLFAQSTERAFQGGCAVGAAIYASTATGRAVVACSGATILCRVWATAYVEGRSRGPPVASKEWQVLFGRPACWTAYTDTTRAAIGQPWHVGRPIVVIVLRLADALRLIGRADV